MIKDKFELDKIINDFIKYCQEHSLDEYVLDAYGEDVFINNISDMDIFVSNNYVHCSYLYNIKTYVFRFKDVDALLIFDKFFRAIDREALYFSIEDIINDFKLDYEENETTTIINGHSLKSCVISSNYEPPRIYTFDDDTNFKLMDVSLEKYFVIHSNIQTVVGKLSRFNGLKGWITAKEVPAELKDLVNLQKVILTMIGE